MTVLVDAMKESRRSLSILVFENAVRVAMEYVCEFLTSSYFLVLEVVTIIATCCQMIMLLLMLMVAESKII